MRHATSCSRGGDLARNLATSRARVTAASRSLPPQLNTGRSKSARNLLKVDTMEMMRHPDETTNMRRQTVSSYFRYSLMDLLSKMVGGQPHFVRCIKPNDDRQALRFSQERVMVQLRYTGILETVNIRRQGYSHRIPFEEFVNRYYYLTFRAHQMPEPIRENVSAILQQTKLESWVLGRTKVFLKYYHVEQLNLLLRGVIGRVVLMQAYTRGWLGARRYRRQRDRRHRGATLIQAAWRGYSARQNVKHIRREREEAAVRIQSAYRGHRVRRQNGRLQRPPTPPSPPGNVPIRKENSQVHADGRGRRDKGRAEGTGHVHHWHVQQGPEPRPQQRAPRRRGQQPKLLNSAEDSLYYNQLNRTLDHQGSKRKPRKLGQIKVLDGEDEYYRLLSTAESVPEEDVFSSSLVSPT
ncbi:myosin-IIIb-like [Denticeps clupeoides]|uniref:myosin-IIIb-like n=1 Tax=Denticeps clupeoides TaxID=299321 RepID=UPI0010A4A0FF|nr:myosin-IIIb-like [Denticeps clupeoides]